CNRRNLTNDRNPVKLIVAHSLAHIQHRWPTLTNTFRRRATRRFNKDGEGSKPIGIHQHVAHRADFLLAGKGKAWRYPAYPPFLRFAGPGLVTFILLRIRDP